LCGLRDRCLQTLASGRIRYGWKLCVCVHTVHTELAGRRWLFIARKGRDGVGIRTRMDDPSGLINKGAIFGVGPDQGFGWYKYEGVRETRPLVSSDSPARLRRGGAIQFTRMKDLERYGSGLSFFFFPSMLFSPCHSSFFCTLSPPPPFFPHISVHNSN